MFNIFVTSHFNLKVFVLSEIEGISNLVNMVATVTSEYWVIAFIAFGCSALEFWCRSAGLGMRSNRSASGAH